MERAVSEMINTLRRAHKTHREIVANSAMEMEQVQQKMRCLHDLGSCFAVMGTLHSSVAAYGLARPPVRMVSYPTYKFGLLLVILGVMFISGLIEVIVGISLMDNPHPNRRIAKIIMWTFHLTTVFAIGFLMACFAPA